ncbi:MAG TPA: ABC transporter ATP-binding protein [Thermomicrobiales bacterium]|nr:ABC transporter ATP-binding protein [Thermomicrobiales bacterium]
MSDPLVRVESVSFAYPGDAGEPPRIVLHDVSLAIEPGEFIALIGQNGSGKTTLARHLNGLLKPSAGRVLVGGVDSRTVPVGELARQVGYVFQNPDHQLFLPSVEGEIGWGPRQLGLSGAELDERVRSTLERFGLTVWAEHHPAMLGRGLRRLTALAAVSAMGPHVLVLDEPTGGLDRRLKGALMVILRGLTAEGYAVVLITHEMALVAEHAARVVVLHAGRIVADEAPTTLFHRLDLLADAGIEPPPVARLAHELRCAGMPAEVATAASFVDAFVELREAGR